MPACRWDSWDSESRHGPNVDSRFRFRDYDPFRENEEVIATRAHLCFAHSVCALAAQLTLWVEKICPKQNKPWLHERWQGLHAGQVVDLQRLFSAAGRRLGVGELPPPPAELRAMAESWSRQDLGRIAGLVTLLDSLGDDQWESVVTDLYFRGSADEKAAVLRALPLLPQPERWVELAVEACRTNTVTVFEAIAQDNPFAATQFTDAQMNQLILKALFLGLDVQRIVGLLKRVTPQLKSDLSDYRREREAAGRAVPEGISWILQKAEQR